MDDSPVCFVLMPFGRKTEPSTGRLIDFDAVYAQAICPAVLDAGMQPLRGDQEHQIGIIHEQFFGRLLLAPFAVADLTTRNANVFYEFGVRHAVKPRTTVGICGNPDDLPFDVSYLRTAVYPLDQDGALVADALPAFHETLVKALDAAKRKPALEHDEDVWSNADSPLFRLIRGFSVTIPDLPHLRADDFSERAKSVSSFSVRIADIRARAVAGTEADAVAALDAVRDDILTAKHVDLTSLTELFLAYRAVSAWGAMVDLFEAMPKVLQSQQMVREQYAMALNRVGEKGDPAMVDRALTILEELEAKYGANPETCGLIGRVHKARWTKAREAKDPIAVAHLNRAIEAYRRGFAADPRDYYPGVNLVTLLASKGAAGKAELDRTVPVVRYAAERRLAGQDGDYWDHATLLELAVLARDETAAVEAFAEAVARIKETFQPKTTADNLSIILDNAPDRDRLAFAEEMREALVVRVPTVDA